MTSLDDTATQLLRQLTGDPASSFRSDQLEAIRALAGDHRRVLLVQRTGWGKSAVYFIATKLLRDQGAGPTILVSPLLALMRNQVLAAQRMGVRAATINSSNSSDWAEITDAVAAGEIDLLLVSPERLANRRFQAEVLDSIGPRAGLVVVDEAHCISDWGHDFRPDYRRVRRILDLLGPGVPVLACTATANDRVVADVQRQLGDGLLTVRGLLGRDGLALQVIDLPTPAERMAWLTAVLPTLTGTGIVYCLTVDDAHRVSEWLSAHGIRAEAYTGSTDGREDLEDALLGNEVDVLVATSALGMGFDKPDLAFVIHFQAPGSPVTYYQQVGRAGRALESSIGVLLRGREDADINDWFRTNAFPSEAESRHVLAVLDDADGPVSLSEIQEQVNVKPTRLDLLLKNLQVDQIVVREGSGYQRTLNPWRYDGDHVAAITEVRLDEEASMGRYATSSECRMAFLGRLLDDPHPTECGLCDNCRGPFVITAVSPEEVANAESFIRHRPITIQPRKQWPDRSRIRPNPLVEGRALCRWGDPGWGEIVRRGKQDLGRFEDSLVDGLLELVTDRWQPDPAPTWITCVPSLRHPTLVVELASRLGTKLDLPFVAAVEKVRETTPQRAMANSGTQFANIADAFVAREPLPEGPVLLIDDIVDSRWTMTVVAHQLGLAGCEVVHPLALASAAAS